MDIKENSINIEFTDGEKISLEMAKLGHLDLANYKDVSETVGLALKNAISKSISTGAMMASIGSALPANGLFTASVSPALLTKLGDGTVSTMIHGSNGIIANKGFIPISASSTIFVPIIAFQIAAFITGQYFLNGISSQLKEIQEGIGELIELHHVEKEAILDMAYEKLQEFAQRDYVNIEDLNSLNYIETELLKVFSEYKRQFEMIDPETIPYMKNFDFATSKVEKMQKVIAKDKFDFKFNMVIVSDELIKLTKIIKLKMCILLQDQSENRRKQIADLFEEIKSWNEQNFYRVQFENSDLSSYYDNILATAKDVCRRQIVSHKKVSEAIRFFRERARVFESVQKSEIEVLKIAKKFVSAMELPTKFVIQVLDENQVKVYAQKQIAA